MSKRRQWTCPGCDGQRTYFDRYDIYGCLACDVWLETVCGVDNECTDCPFPAPPAKPSLVQP